MTPAVHVVDVLTPDQERSWDRLVEQSELPSPFLRSWWLGAVAVPQLRFLLVKDGDTLVGGAALERHRRLGTTTWRVAGGGKLCPDHLDVVARPEDAPRVGAALVRALTAPHSWHVDLDGLREDSTFAAACRAAGWAVQEEVTERAPYVVVASSQEDYLASRSKNFVRKARKLSRRAQENGLVVEQVEHSRLSWALDRFEELNVARGDRRELLAEMPRIRAMVGAGTREGELAVHVAQHDGRVVAMALVITAMGASRNYQTVRALDRGNDGAAMLTHLAVIESARAAGHREMDFLRGAEPYKYDYTDVDRAVVRLRVAGGAGRVTLVATAVAARVKKPLRRVAKKFSGGWITARLPVH